MPTKIDKKIKDKVVTLISGGIVERETVKKVKQPNIARKIEFEVGDAEQDDFFPQFKTKHWDNECNFSARLVAGQGAVTEHDGKLAYDDGEQIARFYEKDTGDEDGGFEFDVVLPKKPKSNVIRWTIQHKGLDFFYQPELTPKDIEEGAERPENVVGSYAVYHKTGRNNKVGGKEYRTGKAFHIYRPKAHDALNNEVWCDLNIDEVACELTVTVPQDFLNSATYPVVVDPTFGYTSAGASGLGIAFSTTSRRVGNTATLGEAGTLDSLHAAGFVSSGSETISTKMFINTLNDPSSNTHAEIANVENASQSYTTSKTFKTFTAASEVLAADDYITSVVGDYADVVSSSGLVAYDSSGGAYYAENFGSYASAAEDPWTASQAASFNVSVYATYTASGGGGGRRRIIIT